MFSSDFSAVALYTARLVTRSRVFRFFSVLMTLSVSAMLIFDLVGNRSWNVTLLPSYIPFASIHYINIAQIFLVIILVSSSVREEMLIDSVKVLYVRPFTNISYCIGKFTGTVIPLLIVNLQVMVAAIITLLILQVENISYLSWLTYTFLITLPAVIFAGGLTLFISSATRSQALTITVIAVLFSLFYLFGRFRYNYLLDFMAFDLPLVRSEITGIYGIESILVQRLIWLLSGIAFAFLSILFFDRLPGSRRLVGLNMMLGFIPAVITIVMVVCYIDDYNTERKSKEYYISLNKRYSDHPYLSITKMDISLDYRNRLIQCNSDILLVNDSGYPSDTLILSLNPSLEVTRVMVGNKEKNYFRKSNFILIPIDSCLQQGDTSRVAISYFGKPGECYYNPAVEPGHTALEREIGRIKTKGRQIFLTDNFLLLTPELNWYPVTGTNPFLSGPLFARTDYCIYKMAVTTQEGLIPVSQGNKSVSDGIYYFQNDKPLPGITLVAGRYDQMSVNVDSIDYQVYVTGKKEYYLNQFQNLSDTLAGVISSIMSDLENRFNTYYPYNNLKIVEVPADYQSIPGVYNYSRSEVQPAMVLLPERLCTLGEGHFRSGMRNQRKGMEEAGLIVTDKELELSALKRFINSTMVRGSEVSFEDKIATVMPSRYSISSNFWNFTLQFKSKTIPGINNLLLSRLQRINLPGQVFARSYNKGIYETDQAALLLNNNSYKDMLTTGQRNSNLRILIDAKADQLWNFYSYLVGKENWETGLYDYLNRNRFTTIDFDELTDEVCRRFGVNNTGFPAAWIDSPECQVIRITGLDCCRILTGEREAYNVKITISNEGDSPAIAEYDLSGKKVSGIVFLKPHQSKRIGIISYSKPKTIKINTGISVNIPGVIEMACDFPAGIYGDCFEGEAEVAPPDFYDNNSEIIIDNEDKGFFTGCNTYERKIDRITGTRNYLRPEYTGEVDQSIPYSKWQKVASGQFYGEYIHSAVYSLNNDLDCFAGWSAMNYEPGIYDLYYYLYRKGGYSNEEMHFSVCTGSGTDRIIFIAKGAERGWNRLGSFYLESDSVIVRLEKVEHSNIILADAIKWIKSD